MNKYTIYCTTEQTRKAHVLGAPIDIFGVEDITRDLVRMATDEGQLDEVEKELNDYNHATIIGELAYCIPTAEQMLGWLEEQGITFEVIMANMKIAYYTLWRIDNKGAHPIIGRSDNDYHSRKEATIAAFDAALYYLANNKV